MAKKKESHKIKEVIENMKPVYEEIKEHEKTSQSQEVADRDDYKYWIIKIIDILEKTGKVNEDLYSLIIETYPKIKETLDELLEQVNLFTIYEEESSVLNSNYEAYLIKIKEIIEQE